MVSAAGFFCETIRSETSGQETAIGIFPDNLNIDIPGVLPNLAGYVRINTDPNVPPKSLSVIVTLTDGQQVTNEIDPSIIDKAAVDAKAAGHPLATLLSRMQFVNLPIKAPGQISLTLRIDGVSELIAAMMVRKIPKT